MTMSDNDRRVVEHFRDRVRGAAMQGVRVTLRVAGGFPSERLDHRLVLLGDGEARLDVNDARDPTAGGSREEKLDADSIASLYAEIDGRLDRFASGGQAAFVPDSLVGFLTIEVDGDAAELVFGPDQSLLPSSRETESTAFGDLARRTILAAQRPPTAGED
jgi:hypothetical protein